MKVHSARNSDAADSAIKHVTMMGANKWDGNHVILRDQLMIVSCGLKFSGGRRIQKIEIV